MAIDTKVVSDGILIDDLTQNCLEKLCQKRLIFCS